MHPAIQKKLDNLQKKHEELKTLLSDPSITKDLDKFRNISKEFAQIEPIFEQYQKYLSILTAIDETKEMLQTDDPELKKLASEEIKELESKVTALEEKLQIMLIPEDPHDQLNVFLEIRAGTGGDESAIFAGDLFRMYAKYAEKQGWKIEILGESESERGGYKEIIARVSGRGAYAKLKFESGAHRVQRVPETEAQGRIHTSTCTVAVFPEVEEVDSITINPADLRIDTYRAQGAGGQHVNKTDSAVRLTHIPTGTVVACQSERSQIQNRAKAMALLQSKILDDIQEKQRNEQAETRRSLVGTGKRAERIRTYNFPQGRMTDHRINFTSYNLTNIMEGDIDEIIEMMMHEYKAEQLQVLTT